MRLQRLLILSALLFLFVPLSVSADTTGEAIAEGAASALGNAMRDIGLDISGGSLPATVFRSDYRSREMNLVLCSTIDNTGP